MGRDTSFTKMASRRPCKDVEKKRRQLKCVNRQCRDGENLVGAFEMVCQYYGIEFRRGKMVCKTCFKKSLTHYARTEKLMKEGKCAMETKFPNFGKHFVIDSSSEDELESQPNTSVSNLSIDKKTSDCLSLAVKYVLDKNKDMIEKQIKLCDEYIDGKVEYAKQRISEFDEFILEVENELADMRRMIYDPYKPNIVNESCVDISDIVDNIPTNGNEVDKGVMVVSKTNKRGHIQETEEDKTDKDIIIAVNHTLCNVPADLPKEGIMVYPNVQEGEAVYAMTNLSDKPEVWQKCKVGSLVGNGFIAVCYGGNGKKILHPKKLAYTPRNPVRFHVGSRVISKYTNPKNVTNKQVDNFYAGIIAEPPSVLNKFRYMIFFDDGRVQYRHHKDIRLIVHKPNEVWNVVYNSDSSYKEFLERYLEKYPERHMVRLANKHNVIAKFREQWMSAKVIEVDASLVRLYFMETQEMEWLYRGSARLLNIHDKLKGLRMRQSGLEYLNKPFVEFTTQEELKGGEPKRKDDTGENLERNLLIDVCSGKSVVHKRLTEYSENLPTTDRLVMKNNRVVSKLVKLKVPDNAVKPQSFSAHVCNPSCVEWTEYDYKKTKQINVLAIPLHFGFSRYMVMWQSEDSDIPKICTTLQMTKPQKCVFYTCPCGRTVRSMKEMFFYLTLTKSKMTIEFFDFNTWVQPLDEFRVVHFIKMLKDLSFNQEFRPITCVNTLSNQLPPSMVYMTYRKPMPGVHINTDNNFLCGCDCTDDCQDKSKCACWQLTIKNQKIIPIDDDEFDPNIGYHYRRLPDRVITGIYECNSTCKCSKSCLNRVVQQPLSHKLQLFMTEKKGWGVRCLNDIPSGSFICIYVGNLLTENDANQGGLNYGDEYLAELDYIEVVEKTKEGYEKTVNFSDDEKNNTMNSGDKETVSETSDDDYQAPYEKASRVVSSDNTSRLRGPKRKVKDNNTKKKNKTKKSKVRVFNPEPPKSVRDYFGEDESVYIMDAKTSGNIGRYLNHSCNPNIFVQNVFVDTHDIRFPWISFFAIHYISAGTELTWDYSYDIGSVPGKKMMCYCESTLCRKRLL